MKKYRVFVIGLSKTGKSVIQGISYLKDNNLQNLEVITFDSNPEIGANYSNIKDLEESELLESKKDNEICYSIISPGIDPNNEIVKTLQKYNVPILSDIEFAYSFYNILLEKNHISRKVWIGITGTNGKTTTVRMVEKILNDYGKVAKAVGNIGESIIEAIIDKKIEVLILELSSFQLYWTSNKNSLQTASNNLKLDIGLIMNIAPDHLNWHGSFEDYKKAKLKIYDFAGKIIEGSYKEDEHCSESGIKKNSRAKQMSNEDFAIEIAKELSVPIEDSRRSLEDFTKEEFRLENLGMQSIGKFEDEVINDSKSTNPHSINFAISQIVQQNKRKTSSGNIVLIMGGSLKGLDFNELIRNNKSVIKHIIIIGEQNDSLVKDIISGDIKYSIAEGKTGEQVLQNAINMASTILAEGDILLFSPGAASFDRFSSYVERGRLFNKVVLRKDSQK